MNKHLQRFNDKLPHVARLSPDLYKGARHGLIIVRQVHWAGELTPEDVKDITACQQEIRELLEELLRKKWIDSVHQEGRMAAGEPQTDPNYDKHPAAADQGLRDVPHIAEFGAVSVLRDNGLLVKGAERTKEYDASGPAMYMPDGKERTELLFEARERALLKIVHEGKDRIACTVYGAAHEWNNNVEEWNNDHPDDQFSILTVTTKSVWERDRRAINRRQNWTPQPPEPLPVPPPPAPDQSIFPKKAAPKPAFSHPFFP